jgi:hypothetical protein
VLASSCRLKYGLALGSGVLYILENTPSPCQCHLVKNLQKEKEKKGKFERKMKEEERYKKKIKRNKINIK